MTLRYVHLGLMHLLSAVESLDGLTPSVDMSNQMAHKMLQSVESSEQDKIQSR